MFPELKEPSLVSLPLSSIYLNIKNTKDTKPIKEVRLA